MVNSVNEKKKSDSYKRLKNVKEFVRYTDVVLIAQIENYFTIYSRN